MSTWWSWQGATHTSAQGGWTSRDAALGCSSVFSWGPCGAAGAGARCLAHSSVQVNFPVAGLCRVIKLLGQHGHADRDGKVGWMRNWDRVWQVRLESLPHLFLAARLC